MAEAVASDSSVAPGVFSRKASGLIRVGTTLDVFIFNVGLVSVGIAIAYNQYYGPSLYPGAQPWVSTLLAAAGMLFVAAAFYCWSVVFPRSGGVYVFLSRTINPGVAFVMSLIETIILLYYAALAAGLIVQVGLSSFFGAVGTVARNSTLVSWGTSVATPAGVFWIGTLIIVVAGALLISGTRRYFTVQRVLFVIAVLGLIVIAIVMLAGSRAGFASSLSTYTGLHYQQVITTAGKHGFVSAASSFGESWKFIVWPLLPLLGAVQSIGIGGEIKKVSRSQLLGMLGAVVATGVVIALFALLANKDFGYTFQGAIAYNALTGVSGGTTATAPWFAVLAGVLGHNVVLSVVILATFAAWIWFWIPAELAYTTRSMIAWSFDRVAPNRLGYVSENVHTPVVAIGTSTAGAVVFMWFIAFKAVAFLTFIEVLLVIWGAVMIAAVLFPFTRKRLYEASPARNFKVARIPIMPAAGAISAVFFAVMFWLLWNDPNAAGPLIHPSRMPVEAWITLGALVVGTGWYVGIKWYRKRRGIDISLAFQQIPIE
ncbi:amino acid permease [Trebonia sp.]|uniref:amino acid permease n=1 Tax=Trebonia sp. TaxID=2767075 RepID=UPI0026313A8D|nr:amino acid permease [Trebonia sp.]